MRNKKIQIGSLKNKYIYLAIFLPTMFLASTAEARKGIVLANTCVVEKNGSFNSASCGSSGVSCKGGSCEWSINGEVLTGVTSDSNVISIENQKVNRDYSSSPLIKVVPQKPLNKSD